MKRPSLRTPTSEIKLVLRGQNGCEHGRDTVTRDTTLVHSFSRLLTPSRVHLRIPRRRSAAALLSRISRGCQPTGTRVLHRFYCSEPSESLSDTLIMTATSVGNRVSLSCRTLHHRKTIDSCLLHRCTWLVKRPDQRQNDSQHQAFRYQCEHRHAVAWQHAAALCAISTLSGCVCASATRHTSFGECLALQGATTLRGLSSRPAKP